tara:strand:- start:247 stop:447 length:201 start_codon:yes stop_codon:yes gene_type:complete
MAGRSETKNMSDSHYGRVARVLKEKTSTPELRRIYLEEETKFKKQKKLDKAERSLPLWKRIVLFWR